MNAVLSPADILKRSAIVEISWLLNTFFGSSKVTVPFFVNFMLSGASPE